MDIGSVVTWIASVLGILTFFGIALNVRQIVGSIRARLDVRRKRLEAQQQQQIERLAAALVASQKAELDSKFDAWKSLLETALKGQQDNFEHRIAQWGIEETTDYHALADRIQALEDRMPEADAELHERIEQVVDTVTAMMKVMDNVYLKLRNGSWPEEAQVEQMARDEYAKLHGTPRGVPVSDAPRGR